MIKATIKSIDKDVIVSTKEEYLKVSVEILDGKNKEVRNFGYPLGTSQKEILKDLSKTVENLQTEKNERANGEVADTINADVTKLQELIGQEAVAETETGDAKAKKNGKNK